MTCCVVYFEEPGSKFTSNPVFGDPTVDTWDHDKPYAQIIGFGASDYRMWYGCADSSGSQNIAYATSTDGVSWSRPTLNQVTYGGNTNNNLLHAAGDYGGYVYYDAAGATGQKFLMMLEEFDSTSTGIRIMGSDDGFTGWATVKTIFTSGAFDSTYKEGKSIMQRADGHFMAFYNSGHPSQLRSIGYFMSDTTDPSGTWTDKGLIPNLVAPDSNSQFYRLQVYPYEGVWLGFASRYDHTNEVTAIDLWMADDPGVFWRQINGVWLPRSASGWDSKVLYSGALVQVGSEWRVYYTAGNQAHNLSTENERVGYAVVTP